MVDSLGFGALHVKGLPNKAWSGWQKVSEKTAEHNNMQVFSPTYKGDNFSVSFTNNNFLETIVHNIQIIISKPNEMPKGLKTTRELNKNEVVKGIQKELLLEKAYQKEGFQTERHYPPNIEKIAKETSLNTEYAKMLDESVESPVETALGIIKKHLNN